MKNLDWIELNQMTFFSYHGVMEQERKVGNTFIVDLKLALDLTQAIESDRLEDTISYADVYLKVKEIMAKPSNLLEHVAGRIIKQLKQEFPPIQEIEVRIAKTNPPLGGDIHSAAICLKSSKF